MKKTTKSIAILLSLIPTFSTPAVAGSYGEEDNEAAINRALAQQQGSNSGVPKGKAIKIWSSDFRNGTYRITKPGRYKLMEDVSFNPHPVGSRDDKGQILDAYKAGRPFRSQYGMNSPDKYDPRAYGIGFFAAISIESDNVILNLNGHRIEQSAEHALHQRFFSVIELADRPFIPKQGPSDFGGDFNAASHVKIKNGVIGRSSHHGIHGNGNTDIVVNKVSFEDFEVAALALNGVEKLRVRNSVAKSRNDVPVLGTYSNARFISAYVDWLVFKNSTTTLKVQGKELTAQDVQESLKDSINSAFEDIIQDNQGFIDPVEHPDTYALYHNREGVIDGNAYGFLVNPLGVAVHGFPTQVANPAHDIVFNNVRVEDLRANVSEVVGISRNGNVVTDPVGALFILRNKNPLTGAPLTISSLTDPNATYTGNVLSNAQALVAKAAAKGEFPSFLDTSRTNIDQEVLNWIEDQTGLQSIVKSELDYRCNGDTMFHVNKGVIGFKVDGAEQVKLKKVSVQNLENMGASGSSVCGDYAFSHPKATLEGYGGNLARGISVAGSDDVRIIESTIDGVTSASGDALGIHVLTDASQVVLRKCELRDVVAGASYSASDSQAVGVKVEPGAKVKKIKDLSTSGLSGPGGAFEIVDPN